MKHGFDYRIELSDGGWGTFRRGGDAVAFRANLDDARALVVLLALAVRASGWHATLTVGGQPERLD